MKSKTHHYEDAIYHVMFRGNNKQNLFFKNADYEFFIERIKHCIERYQIKVHLFCLMTNHVHLLVQVGHVPLRKAMQSLHISYTLKVNHRYKRFGHITQGRFVEKLVQNEKYLLELCYYIHHNPIKAKIAENLDDYVWSSHHAYINKKFDWVHTELINSLLKKHATQQSNGYEAFIFDRESAFATPQFFQIDADGKLHTNDEVNKATMKSKLIDLKGVPFEKIITSVCNHFEVAPEKLISESSAADVVLARSVSAYIGHYYANYYLSDLAYHFGRNYESFSRTMHSNLNKVFNNSKLKIKLDRVIKNLSVRY